MEYLFLRRRNRSTTSERQKQLLSKAVRKQWEEDFVRKGIEGEKDRLRDLQVTSLSDGDKDGVLGYLTLTG